ncbi:MAG TPA: HEAT repeat domain-containing protein [Planctomycetota bacterium]
MARTLALLTGLLATASSAGAYITAPVQTLGALCGSTYITLVEVEKFNREKGVIIYRKVRDLKGQYPRDRIRHAFDLKNTPLHKGAGDVPVRPDAKDWDYATGWAEAGKTAVIFSLKYDPFGDFGHTYIDGCWYATMCPARDWDFWWAIYADPALLTRWHCGTPAQLATSVERVLAGKTAVVPSLAGGSRDDLRAGRARIQGLKVGLQIGDFNLERDRVANWPPREVPALIRDLDHADRQARLQALTGLSGAGAEGRPAVARLLALLGDPDEETRLAAFSALSSIDPGNVGMVPAAIALLRNPDRANRVQAAVTLGEIGPAAKGAVEALAETVSRDGSGTVRMRAADALGKIGPAAKTARPALEAALKDPAMAARPEVLARIRAALDQLAK